MGDKWEHEVERRLDGLTSYRVEYDDDTGAFLVFGDGWADVLGFTGECTEDEMALALLFMQSVAA